MDTKSQLNSNIQWIRIFDGITNAPGRSYLGTQMSRGTLSGALRLWQGIFQTRSPPMVAVLTTDTMMPLKATFFFYIQNALTSGHFKIENSFRYNKYLTCFFVR